MIREKIFRLHRHKSSSSSAGTDVSGQKFDFTFSNIQALQVPKGWDKLCLSLISYESGKTVCKSGRVPVKKGTCRWTETLSQSLWISDVIDSSKEVEECLLKFLVSMGSSRSSILGETTLNLAAFLSSESPILVSLPLKKCNHGTVLQVEVRCLTPKICLWDGKCKYVHRHKDADDEDMANRSEKSDSTITMSMESCSVGNSSRPVEFGSRETSFSASVSRYSFDSIDDSVGRQSFSSQSDRNGGNNFIGRQDSIESTDNASYCSYSPHRSIKSVHSLQGPQGKNQREELRKLSPSLQRNGCSFETFKEADEGTVQELKAEARMWEQNSRKLAFDMESLRKELSDQNLAKSECQKLTQEIKRLRFLLEESTLKENVGQNSDLQELMEDEIRFEKVANGNLSLQLQKTQESNIELISILQEMEETIEKQKIEIEGLSANKLELIYTNSKNSFRYEDCSEVNVDAQISANESKRLHDYDCGTSIISEISVEDIHEKIGISVLESTLEDKIIETEIEQDLKKRILREFVLECNRRLAAREEKIMNLQASLSRDVRDESLEVSEHGDHVDVRKEIGQLKEKVKELEKDCNELTRENLELLFELKELRNNVSKGSNACLSNKAYNSGLIEPDSDSFEKEEETKALSNHNNGLKLQDKMGSIERDMVLLSGSIYSPLSDNKIDEMRLMEAENNQTELIKHLSELQEENVYLLQRVSGLEAQLRYLTDVKESSHMELQNSEYQVTVLQNQIRILEGEIDSQKLDTKHKLEEIEKQWLEAQEECISLSRLNIKLQSTTESLIEEYNSLQTFNGELREQKLKLQNQCMVLEAEARNFRDFHCNCEENMGSLEVKYSTLKEEITARGEVVLEPNQEKLLQLFENIMNDESKRRSIIEELESRIRFSDLERLRLAEENSILSMQLQKVPELQNEVLALRVSVKEMKSQNQLLKASFESVSGDNEELKHERISMAEKISSLEKAVSEAEVCRSKKNALEEKLLRLEGDLIARDASCVQDAEMKNELHQMRIANSQFVMKVKHLENVREYLRRRLKTLEEELHKKRHDEESQRKSNSENEGFIQQQVQPYSLSKVFNEQDCHSRRSLVPAMDYESRIQLLENELVKVLEANDMYKTQIESFQAVASEKSEFREATNTAKTEHKISLLEAELQEIRDRYLQISLKYAEVEAQREQLVMKLKAVQ